MDADLGLVAEEFGLLEGVHLSELKAGWVDAIRFDFQNGSLVVGLDPEDDTITWDTTSIVGMTSSAPDAWADIVGHKVRWLWELTNHRGYRDGLQIEFYTGRETIDVQLMVEASRLWTYRLGRQS